MNREIAEKAAREIVTAIETVPDGEFTERLVADIIERACGRDDDDCECECHDDIGRCEMCCDGRHPRPCVGTAWVSAKERRPEMDTTPYLVHYVKYKPNADEAPTEIDVWTAQNQAGWYTFEKYGTSGITHWQPLPSPPAAEEEK